MRKLFGITILVCLSFALWFSLASHAHAPYHTTTIDPMGLTKTTTNLLPEVEYDQGTVFLPKGVQY
jgi:hypothetical protein